MASRKTFLPGLLLLLIHLTSCTAASPSVLRLATTTSTYDSGLLDAILPDFEGSFNTRVDVIAVGTGQALALGERGDVDVLLVHDREREEAFVEAGFGTARYPAMYNDFVIVGPKQDPAGIGGMASAVEAFKRIRETMTLFVSRGDQSGTHSRELGIWDELGYEPDSSLSWYLSIGQGMGETLQFADEQLAYTVTDRGTYLSQAGALANLALLVGGASVDVNPDPTLRNPYGVIPINPDRHPNIQLALAMSFVEWLTSEKVQEKIASYGVDEFGQPLFYPAAEE